jgi:hypothetical protein
VGIVRLRLLPDCIDELYRYIADPADEADHRLALETLVDACVITSAVSKELNYLDLAYLAGQRAEEAAAIGDFAGQAQGATLDHHGRSATRLLQVGLG